MKKNLFMVAAVALMALVSCNKEELSNDGLQGGAASGVVFSAELEQPGAPAAEQAPASVQSKTSIGTAVEGVRPVTWNAGDKIKINGVEFSATASGSRTDFTTTSSFTEAETYYAVYPATAAGAADHSKVTIPASQKGTFAEAAISVAKSDTESLKFKNVASIVKFQVPSACSEVTIESTADLAGTFDVTFNGETPSVGKVLNGSKKITLTGSFVTGTDYYVAVLPGSHKFTIRLGGYLSKASTTAVSTKRAVIANLQKLPELDKFSWGIVGEHQGWNITSPTPMYKVADNVYATLNIQLKSNGFKFAMQGLTNWNTANSNFGAWRDSGSGYFNYSTEMSLGAWYGNPLYSNNAGGDQKNIGVSDFSKYYDIYLYVIASGDWGIGVKYTVVPTGTSVTYPN